MEKQGNIEKLHIICNNYAARSTLYEQFYNSELVSLDKEIAEFNGLDCLIVPCCSPFGNKEDVSKDVQSLVSVKVLRSVQKYITSNFLGEQPTGTSFLIQLENTGSLSSPSNSSSSLTGKKKKRGGEEKSKGEEKTESPKEKKPDDIDI